MLNSVTFPGLELLKPPLQQEWLLWLLLFGSCVLRSHFAGGLGQPEWFESAEPATP